MYIDTLNPKPLHEKKTEELPKLDPFEEALIKGVFMETLRQMQRHQASLKKAMQGH